MSSRSRRSSLGKGEKRRTAGSPPRYRVGSGPGMYHFDQTTKASDTNVNYYGQISPKSRRLDAQRLNVAYSTHL